MHLAFQAVLAVQVVAAVLTVSMAVSADSERDP
jgi:hypothetical protein